MRIPNLFIFKFLSVDTLTTGSILICRVTTLSHEAFDDSVENDVFVVIWNAFVSNTEWSEVFCSLWNQFSKKLENNSSFFSVFDLNIKESLRIFLIELRKLIKSFRRNFHFFFVINTLREEFSHGSGLRLWVLFFLSFDVIKILSEFFVLRADFDCLFDVIQSIIKVLKFCVSHTSQIESFYRFFVNLNYFCTFFNCLTVVADAI